MDRTQIAEIVRDAIDGAAEAKGWSLAQLARQLGMGETTLHRWRSGTNAKYDLGTLVKLFGMAGMSMDEEFGISREDSGEPQAGRRETERLRQELAEIKAQLELLRPLAEVMRTIARSAAAMQGAAAEPDEVLAARRARTPYGPSAVVDAAGEAIALGEKLAKEGQEPAASEAAEAEQSA
jgi:transcriptional regulator with XRE-family HTH domain